MEHPEFRPITLSDKAWIDSLLRAGDSRKTEYCFTSLYMWAENYGSTVARLQDRLLVRSIAPGQDHPAAGYLFPAGSGDLRTAIDAILADAERIALPFFIHCLSPENLEELRQLTPDISWESEPVRDSFDYIYDREALATLTGKKYQPKRNFISRFTRDPDWNYERILPEDPRCPDLIRECLTMNEEWCRLNGCRHNPSLQAEVCAGRKVLEHFRELDLRGGLLRRSGKPVAFTVGEPVNSDTFIVHIEKAFADVEGAYPMINRSFIRAETEGFRYINREDDAGDEGLRKAKLSYHPVFLEEKFSAWKK